MLEGKNLEKRYGNFTALSGVDLSVSPGEIVALLGPNGSGKSTLISLLSMCLKPDGGEVTVDGERGREAKKLLSFVPQDVVLFEELSVIDNLKCFSSIKGAQAAERIKELSRTLLLTDFMKKRVDKLSGGQRRRVNIAVAMMCYPKYLLLDEPFAGVDEKSGDCLIEYLLQLKNAGMGMVISEHDKERIASLADRVIMLEKGHMA